MQADQRIELANGAALELRFSEAEVVLVSAAGEQRRQAGHPLLGESRDGAGAPRTLLLEGRAAGLIGYLDADRIHFFDAEAGTLHAIPTVDRLPGTRELRLVATPTLMLVMTENGVVAIDHDGSERWRIDQVTYRWRFVGESEGVLWLSDTNDNLIGIDPATGEEAG
jgi:hypothetical protein